MNPTESASPRKLVYALLIVVAAGGVAGRIASVSQLYDPEQSRDPNNPADARRKWPEQRPRPMPIFGSNDRSRWATVRSLVEEGTYVVGKRYPGRRDPKAFRDSGIIFEDGWQSVDKVLHPEKHEFCSSKPPLLSTLVAGLYWLLYVLFGWTFSTEPFTVVRTLLMLINLVPFVIYLVLLSRLLDRCGGSDWSRWYVLAAACFATLMTPFLLTFNNHTVATCCVLFAVYAVWPLLQLPWRPAAMTASHIPWRLASAGFFAAFTVANELPALAFLGALGLLLVWRLPRETLLYFVPAALVPLAALLWTNYLALEEFGFAYDKFGTVWYEYEGSHWRKPREGEVKHGIDWASYHETRAQYAFHVLLGHHGLFSLSPIWLLAVAGMVIGVRALRRREPEATVPRVEEEAPSDAWNVIAGLTLLLTAVVVGFYLVKSDNYGGWTAGLRWLMWLTPLWLLTMMPAVNWMGQRRWGRWVAYGLLAWSVFSVSYPAWSPWRHPWLYNLMESGGYVAY
jgi:hypothetical protein